MSGLRCKPGQMATIVREARTDLCVGMRLGCPVKVLRLYQDRTLAGLLCETIDGPAWEVEHPPSCPLGQCTGLEVIPDRCLRPFDEGSEPAADDKPVEIERPAGVEVLTTSKP